MDLITERSAGPWGEGSVSVNMSVCLHVFTDICLPGQETQTADIWEALVFACGPAAMPGTTDTAIKSNAG